MDPVIAQAVAALITACATALTLAAAYYWGPRRRNGNGNGNGNGHDDGKER